MILGRLRASGFAVTLLCGVSSLSLLAAAYPATAQERTVEFSIEGGALGTVLTAIGSAAAAPISFSPDAVRDLRSGPIFGRMTVNEAVSRAISGTRLRAVVGASETLSVVALNGSQQTSATAPGAAAGDVATDIADIDVSGNGSRTSDAIATEGSGSYSAPGANVATKSNLAIKDTAKSVSVLSDQQLKDRHLTSLNDAVAALPGLTVTPPGGAAVQSGSTSVVAGSNLSTSFQSRGYTISSISIDGGSPINVGAAGNFQSNFLPVFDLSAYDSVSVVRGSAGQYSGIGDPAGVLSLQRKRPLNEAGASLDQSFGSFNAHRTQLDFNTGPLLDGLLKIRSSLVYDDSDFFYRYASKSVKQGYINAELTPAEGTVINIGATINETTGTPWFGGLPTYRSGQKAPFSRDTCLCAPWSLSRVDGQEYFVRATQQIVDDWTLNVNMSANLQKIKSDFLLVNSFPFGGINSDGTGAAFSNLRNSINSNQYKADAFISGKDELFGMKIEPTFGFAYSYVDQSYNGKSLAYGYKNTTNISLFNFNPGVFQPVPSSIMSVANFYQPDFSQQQIAGYANIRLSPTPWLHINVGERFSAYQTNTTTVLNGTTTQSGINTMNVPIPDVSATVDLDPSMSIYGSYATIFNPSLLFSEPGVLTQPITGRTWEAGIKRSDFDGLLTSSLAFYNSELNNVPVLDQSNPNSLGNGNNNNSNCCYIADGTTTITNGIDLEMTGQIAPDWNVTFSYNYNDSKRIYGPESLANRVFLSQRTFPKHIGKAFTVFRPQTGISEIDQALAPVRIGVGAEYGGARFYTAENFVVGQGLVNSTVKASEYITFSAMVKYIINDKAYAQLNLYNLTDRKYYSQVGSIYGGNWYGQPFTAVGSVHLQF